MIVVPENLKLVIFEPYPMGLGGNFLTQRLILERLDRSRFTPIIVAPMEGIALDEFRKMGVECVVLAPPGDLARYGGALLQSGFFGKSRAALDLVRYNLIAAAFLRERQINVIYANCVRAEMMVGFAARMEGVPSLLYIKGELDNPIIDRVCFLLARKILFFSEYNRDDKYPSTVRRFLRKIDILKIGLDPSVITAVENRDQTALKAELEIDPNHINIIMVAQLYRPKGQHLAIEALARLTTKFPNVRLYLLGDHVIDEYRPYRLELDQLVEKHNLQGNVRFTGWRKDALDVVSLMDILIHPSLTEGFGRAVLEGMALGKPVIASHVGGLREAIQNGQNGFLIEPGDINALATKLCDLLVDQSLRKSMGKAARETVFSEYLIADKVERLAAIWSDMVCGKV